MDKIEFMTTEQYTKEEVRRVQEILVIMMKHVHEVLEKNQIPYMISYGTLLGAVRHGGFIPWDDDLDIYIIHETDYDRAMECLRQELPEWMIVHDGKVDPIYWPFWSRLRDLNSETRAELFPDDNHYKYRGINLDLYRLQTIKRNEVDLNIYRHALRFYERKNEIGLVSDEVYLQKKEELEKKIEIELATKDGKPDDEVFSFIHEVPVMEKSDVFPLKKYTFEGIELWGPNNEDAVLKVMYGNYMELPPVESRKPHYSWVRYVDENFDYK